MSRSLEDIQMEVQITEEKCFGVNVDEIINTFEELLMEDEYLPEPFREHFRKPEILQSQAMFVMANLMAFSAIVALRRANDMLLPSNLTETTTQGIVPQFEFEVPVGEEDEDLYVYCAEHGNDLGLMDKCKKCGWVSCIACEPHGC